MANRRAKFFKGGNKIWWPAVRNFLKNNIGQSFTAKEIIDQATLTTKTYFTYKGDRAKYNGQHVKEDKTMIKLIDTKICPSTTALSQSLRGKKEVGKWFDEQSQLTQYFWRVVDEK
tara:strand:- start:169 stop:516 length:348 start_codon:yes stop_codon:yes gene_type:complete